MKVSIIGCGPWGQNIIRTLDGLREEYPIELEAIGHTGDSGRAETVRDLVSVESTTDIARVLDQSDAVFVATPDNTHADYVERALTAGCHVFVEKPICYEPDRVPELYDRATSMNRRLMVGHLMVYHPAVQFLQEQLSTSGNGGVEVFSHRFNNLRPDGGRRLLHSSFIHDLSVFDWFFAWEPETIDLGDVSGDIGDLDYLSGSLRWPAGHLVRFQCGRRWPARRRSIAVRTADTFYDFNGIEETVEVYEQPEARHADAEVRRFDRLPLTLELEDFIKGVLDENHEFRVNRSHVRRVMNTIGRISESVEGS